MKQRVRRVEAPVAMRAWRGLESSSAPVDGSVTPRGALARPRIMLYPSGVDRPTRRAGPFAERVRVVAACSALALVGWQAVVAAEDVVSELSSRPLRHHRRALESTPDELIRLHLGKDHELYRALREHLPPDAKVLISFRDSREGYAVLRRRVTRLGALSYPITFRSWPYDAARPELDRPGKDARREFVLDLDSGRDYSVWPVCEELARGEGYRLLIVGSEAP